MVTDEAESQTLSNRADNTVSVPTSNLFVRYGKPSNDLSDRVLEISLVNRTFLNCHRKCVAGFLKIGRRRFRCGRDGRVSRRRFGWSLPQNLFTCDLADATMGNLDHCRSLLGWIRVRDQILRALKLARLCFTEPETALVLHRIRRFRFTGSTNSLSFT